MKAHINPGLLGFEQLGPGVFIWYRQHTAGVTLQWARFSSKGEVAMPSAVSRSCLNTILREDNVAK